MLGALLLGMLEKLLLGMLGRLWVHPPLLLLSLLGGVRQHPLPLLLLLLESPPWRPPLPAAARRLLLPATLLLALPPGLPSHWHCLRAALRRLQATQLLHYNCPLVGQTGLPRG